VNPVLFNEAHERFGQHRYDANQHFFAGLNSIPRGKSFGHRSIQDLRLWEPCKELEIGH
jgi:hypothetical protein